MGCVAVVVVVEAALLLRRLIAAGLEDNARHRHPHAANGNKRGDVNVDRLGNSLSLFSSRRRHTRCYRDWSSDVCSSDLQLSARYRKASLIYAKPTVRRTAAKSFYCKSPCARSSIFTV